ncbi:MAG: hypothetical protein M3R51_07565 [Candidatus Eremiobacteraeota bacterium]|nr:hypothetical protein [Candidatus Eremiobacteraeota bacterium]
MGKTDHAWLFSYCETLHPRSGTFSTTYNGAQLCPWTAPGPARDEGHESYGRQAAIMEHTLVHLAATAAWLFFILFVFAVVGVVAIVRWIINAVTNTERAVASGVEQAGRRITHRDQ